MELEHNTVTVEQVPSGAPSVAVAKSIAALTRFCQAVALIALATLALRSALRLESQWDTFWYHLPFAAVRGGLSIPYDMNDVRRLYFEGFPPLPDLLQGILWRLTGSVNATGVVNYLAFVAFLVYCHVVLRAEAWLVALIALTAPMVLIHTTVSYVDLFGNAFLAAGLGSCLGLYLEPHQRRETVLIGGLVGFAGAAWSKFLLVPVVSLGLFVLFLVALRAARRASFSPRRIVLLILAGAIVAALPYVKNFLVYQNPFWPVRMPIASAAFPYRYADTTEDRHAERPPPLKEASQFTVFVHSLLEIHHPRRYSYRARWIIDQGNTWVAFRSGGFWWLGTTVYLLTTVALLIFSHRRTGIVAAAGLAGLVCFTAILPQSNELRYYQFLPLCWAAAIGMLFSHLRKVAPRAALGLLTVVIGLFLYMVSENWMHYRIERIGYSQAAREWGATQLWPLLEQGKTYCAVDMMPMAMMLTGPTMSEFTIVDRTQESLCPEGSVVVTRAGVGTVVRPDATEGVVNRRTAEDYLNESLSLFQARQYERSLAAAERAAIMRPAYAAAYNNMCAAYNAMGRWDEGIGACERAIELDPDFAMARNNLSWAMRGKAEARD